MSRTPHRLTAMAVVAIVVLISVMVVTAVARAAKTPKPPASAHWAAGEVLVEYRAAASAADVRGGVKAAGARVAKKIGTPWASQRRLVLVVSSGQSIAELMATFAKDPLVLRVSPNYRRSLDAVPGDTSYGQQWGLPQIGAETAWDTTTGSSSVVVADLDTGVDYTHPDLSANMWHNSGETPGNGIDDDGNGYVDDYYGFRPIDDTGDPYPYRHFSGGDTDPAHGTHTAGIMGATGANGVGIAGTAWTTRIMAIEGFRRDGYIYDSEVIQAIDYVIWEKNHGVNVVAVNASWGGAGYNASLRSAILSLGSAGIVFCAGAGNGGGDGIGDDNDVTPHYPASYDCGNIIAVAASTQTDGLTVFSNHGATSVDLAAPGTNILSTVIGTQYESWNGTSMATPFVTGSVALLASKYPSESAAQRLIRILQGTDAVAGLSGMCTTGGRLNVANALAAPPPGDDVIAPAAPTLDQPVSPTNQSTLSLSGTAEAHSTVTLYDGAGVLGTTTAGSDGAFGFAASLPDGDRSLTATATDAAGNTSEASAPRSVIVDTVWPTTTDNTDGLHHQSFNVILSPLDATSGVAATYYRIDGGAWTSGTSFWLVLNIRHKRPGLPRGTHTVEYYSTDSAGNSETPINSCQVILG